VWWERGLLPGTGNKQEVGPPYEGSHQGQREGEMSTTQCCTGVAA
jgi:hypothetical protein